MIVDDDRILRRLFGKKLSSIGLDIIYAANGQEGLQLALSHQPDLIILDIHMPVMSGNEMLKRLRQESAYGENVYVIVVTADTLSTAIRNIDLADVVLQKPVSTPELRSTINNYLANL